MKRSNWIIATEGGQLNLILDLGAAVSQLEQARVDQTAVVPGSYGPSPCPNVTALVHFGIAAFFVFFRRGKSGVGSRNSHVHCLTIWRIIARGCRCTRCVTMCVCALRGGLGGTVARRVPLVGLAVGFLVAFFVFSQKGHRRAKIREHRCKQQMPLMGMARNYDDPEGSFHE